MKSQEPKDRSPKLQGMLLSAYCLLFTILCLISPVLAAEEGGHDAGGDNSTLWRIINFAILAVAVILIARYLKLKDFFASRKENIKRELDEARKAKEETERKMKEFELKFKQLDKKIEEIYQEIRAEGEIEKKKIIEEAIASVEKIKEQARLAAEQELKKAKQEIKGEIAKVAVEMAEEILRHELTAADQERLIREYLEKVRLH
ncbi:MAG: hypothetical protein A2X87_06605 [Deltaproteobacteria bacterium GWC2_42_51]|nr:MAG: hypothetical protein A2056_03540 [Deltaproteobacteria bacterium GWA2_42_85]OGP26370.1 MAG: hypothetical protein A2067_06035 [Deltaproteobacteria bacterium GWB2_42_7]OGP31681.1 MAG: hypothetical protein A2X87_06605 [Deltaproteobacteria bacterium GWC2_42_51]OGP44717.1 MAG: hypothetical protein A2090_00270 [Deltaproteobacteria bacterium GWD2_42_10]OGP46077.1 MAG: hypothetical protein A2022_04370 [Deltaproteobacteria bacterium GWF2_42_12]OGQ30058.1 MAG: hypothetical protein A3D29_04975 [De